VEIKERKTCRSCGEPIEGVLSLGRQSLSSFVLPGETVRYAPLDLGMCEECGLVQLMHTCPGEWLYDWYGYRSGTNRSMVKSLGELARAAAALAGLAPGDSVCDIGSNDGTFLRLLQEGVRKVGFDPAKNLGSRAAEGLDLWVNDYFSASGIESSAPGFAPFKLVTATAMFYDLDDPLAFVRDVRRVLRPDGLFVVQMNYLGTMVERNGYDNIVHEHLTYYSLSSFLHVLAEGGFDAVDVETNDVNGGSFRVYARQSEYEGDEPAGGGRRIEMMLAAEAGQGLTERATFSAFANRVRRTRDELRAVVDAAAKAGKKIYVYGASTRGLVVMEYCGIDSRVVAGAAERNPDKWGRLFAGTGIPCVPEEEARAKADCFIVLPHHFLAEFVEREAEWLAHGGKFIVPLPEVRIIGAGGVEVEKEVSGSATAD
jgi:SAM-dependent methyltransferase